MTTAIIIGAWICVIICIVVVVGGACSCRKDDKPDWLRNEDDMHGGG